MAMAPMTPLLRPTLGLLSRLVGLERDEQVVGVLAGDLGIARVDRLGEVGAMAGGAGGLLQQRRDLRARLPARLVRRAACGSLRAERSRSRRRCRRCPASVSDSAMPRMVGCLRSPVLVGGQGRRDVLGALARDHRDLVDLGEAGLVAHDAVAADAHRDLASSDLASPAARAGGRCRPAAGAAAGAWACAKPVTQATARAKSVVNNLFILRAQSGERSVF